MSQNKVPVSTLLLTNNSRAKLPTYFKAMDWVDDIVMLDGGSTDSTKEYAAEYAHCQIHDQSAEYLDERGYINDFGGMRNYGYTFAKHPWIICIDADEDLDEECMQSIIETVQSGKPGLYNMNVIRRYKGKTTFSLRPVRQVRLFHTEASIGCIKKIHERIAPKEGAYIGLLKGNIYCDCEDYTLQKNYHYLRLELKTLRRLGLWEWFWWVFLFNTRGLLSRFALAIANRLVPKKGPRIPWKQEFLAAHYNVSLTVRSFPFTRKIFPPEVI